MNLLDRYLADDARVEAAFNRGLIAFAQTDTPAAAWRSLVASNDVVGIGNTGAQALRNSIDLARHADRLGFTRYWVAEHHGMKGIASAATAVVIAHVAGATKHIRVGAGGIMLPNHAPLTIAEQFGTLAELFPGRVDLGLGRAPGTDRPTMRALRRSLESTGEDGFPNDVLELQAYLATPRDDVPVRAVPGQGTEVPLWLLEIGRAHV